MQLTLMAIHVNKQKYIDLLLSATGTQSCLLQGKLTNAEANVLVPGPEPKYLS